MGGRRAKREQCNVRGMCLGEDRINKMLHEQEATQQKGTHSEHTAAVYYSKTINECYIYNLHVSHVCCVHIVFYFYNIWNSLLIAHWNIGL